MPPFRVAAFVMFSLPLPFTRWLLWICRGGLVLSGLDAGIVACDLPPPPALVSP